MALDQEDTSCIVYDDLEWEQELRDAGSGGRFWTERSNAPTYTCDLILNQGVVRCHDAFLQTVSRSGLPLQYEHVSGLSIPPGVVSFLHTSLVDYTGPVSILIQEDVVLDIRLRWSRLNCIWLQQIDFVKVAPIYASGCKALRPLSKPLMYIPCWVDLDHQDATYESQRLERNSRGLSLYGTVRDKWHESNGYLRIGIFVVHPNETRIVSEIKKQQGLT